MYAYAGTPRTSCDGAKPAAVQARTAARALADGIEEFLHPSSSGALGPGFEEAGDKKKGGIKHTGRYIHPREAAYIPIRRNSSATPNRGRWRTRTRLGADGHSDPQMARFGLRRISWQRGAVRAADAAERGESLPRRMRKRRSQGCPADRGTPSQCRSHRARNGYRRRGCWKQIAFCFRLSPRRRRSVYKRG